MIGKGEYLMFCHDEMYKPLTDLIESLRTMARAALVVNGDFMHEEDSDLHALDTALAVLPVWVLESEE